MMELSLFNMYMPCDKGYVNRDLLEYEVSEMCNKSVSQFFIMGGDMNTDLSRADPQTRELQTFVDKGI